MIKFVDEQLRRERERALYSTVLQLRFFHLLFSAQRKSNQIYLNKVISRHQILLCNIFKRILNLQCNVPRAISHKTLLNLHRELNNYPDIKFQIRDGILLKVGNWQRGYYKTHSLSVKSDGGLVSYVKLQAWVTQKYYCTS